MKAMLAAREIIANELRPPLVPVSEESHQEIKRVLGLFNAAEIVTQ